MSPLVDLVAILDELNRGIDTIKRKHASPYEVMSPEGRYILLDALAAKANVLVAISHLQTLEEHNDRRDDEGS